MVAYQIHENFDQPMSLPFDWLITPFVALRDLVNEDLSTFFQQSDLELAPDKRTFINRRWGLQHVHDVQIVNGQLPDDWMEIVASDIQGKFDFLTERWRSIMAEGEPVLFVRHRGHVSHISDAAYRVSAEEANDLATAIAQTHPNLDFRLALVSCVDRQDDARMHPKIDLHEVRFHDEEEWPNPDDRWRGCSADWKRVFDQYKQKLTTADSMIAQPQNG